MTLSKDQFLNYNLHEMYALYCDYEKTILDLQQKLQEKQLIIEAKKFADFKPIDNSRVGMTTPNPWIHLVNASIPHNRILEVVDISGDVVLVHWFEAEKVFVKVDPKTMFMTNKVVHFDKWRVFIQ